MGAVTRYPSRTERDAALAESAALRAMVRDLSGPLAPTPDLLAFVARTLAEGLEEEDFTLFRNAGLPLLERRIGPMRVEILFRPGPCANGTAAFHVSHPAVLDLRRTFWPTPAKAPAVVLGGDFFELEQPAAFGTLDLSHAAEAGHEMLALARERVVPICDMLDSESRLLETLIHGEMPMLDDATRLEWLMADYGRAYAAEACRKLPFLSRRGSEVAEKFQLRSRRQRINRSI
jgi:hypothetical protein